jgi:hypothetical protein
MKWKMMWLQKVEQAKEQLAAYRRAVVGLNQDPFAWWKKNSDRYNAIAPLASDRLSVAGTSVPSERLFSAAGDLVSAKRSCISSENVDMLLFLNKNLNA